MELLICPSDRQSFYEVSLWIVDRSAAGLKVRQGPTLDWIAYSRMLERACMVSASVLGQIDACLARGQSVRKLLQAASAELFGLEFRPANVIPRELHGSVLAA